MTNFNFIAELVFRYGVMGCGKTRDIMKNYHDYIEKGKKIKIAKPSKDTRGNTKITSRDGSNLETDYLIRPTDDIYQIVKEDNEKEKIDCILVDEAQFLTRENVKQLSDIVDDLNIQVICFGLRADFKDVLFEGSEALFALADRFEEITSICRCGKYAKAVVRLNNGVPVSDGPQIAIDGENKVTYISMCRKCKKRVLKEGLNIWN